MRAEDLQEVIHARPFRSFTIVFADGKQVNVRHPEWIVHQGRTAVVIEPDERLHIIDMMLVQRIEVAPPVPAGTPAPEPNGGQ